MSSNLATFFADAAVAVFNPTLIAAVMIMLLLPRSKRLMLGYLLGAYAISVGAGLAIVFSLHASGALKTSGHILGPGEDIAAGAVALLISYRLAIGRKIRLRRWYAQRKAAKAARKPPKPPWEQRMLGKGSAAVTFAVGIVMSFPGVVYLSALDHIGGLSLPVALVVLLVILFTMMQQILLEAALVASIFAPAGTQAVVADISGWLKRHRHRLVILGLSCIGIYLVARGLLTIS